MTYLILLGDQLLPDFVYHMANGWFLLNQEVKSQIYLQDFHHSCRINKNYLQDLKYSIN
jgi:hypothetical protein